MVAGASLEAVPEALHVLVGVIENARGEILVAQRQPGKRFAGLWEFPGGKREPGEEPLTALSRELEEELGLTVQAAEPLMCFQDAFADFPIVLDVWHVTEFSGAFTPALGDASTAASGRGQEGQPLLWADQATLSTLEFPPANQRIFKRLRLGRIYGITPPALAAPELSLAERLTCLQTYTVNLVAHAAGTAQGKPVLQVRAHDLSQSDYDALIRAFAQTDASRAVDLVTNRADNLSKPENFQAGLVLPEAGVHVPESRLCALGEYFGLSEHFELGEGLEQNQPTASAESLRLFKQAVASHPGPVGASCHDAASLALASHLGFDYALLSPVMETPSHPGASLLGWAGFQTCIDGLDLPVLALGGLSPTDLASAQAVGAHGVAGISAFVASPQ